MSSPYSVSLAKITKNFKLETVYLPAPAENIYISTVEVNRPGLQFGGYYEFFDNTRIQIIGKSEEAFLNQSLLRLLFLEICPLPMLLETVPKKIRFLF